MYTYQVLLFYKYMVIENPVEFCEIQRALCLSLGLRGRILVAKEGMNVTLSGHISSTKKYIDTLRKMPQCSEIDIKQEPCEQHVFPRLQVRTKREIVHSALPQVQVVTQKALYIAPLTLRNILKKNEKEWVLVDVRDDYEHQLGHFRHAQYLPIKYFREFGMQADALRPLQHKKIITYCTGGIRCEKASAWLLHQGFKEVYQLQGGIIAYAQQTDGAYFEGRCYVFDQRISIPINKKNPSVIAACYRCRQPTEHMINCANMLCNKQILLCKTCAVIYNKHCGMCSPPFKIKSH